jgi:hypothetical protein
MLSDGTSTRKGDLEKEYQDDDGGYDSELDNRSEEYDSDADSCFFPEDPYSDYSPDWWGFS